MSEQRKRFDWFKLVNYEAVERFSIKEWERTINDRMTQAYLLTAPEDAFVNYSQDELKERHKEILAYWEFVRTQGASQIHPLYTPPPEHAEEIKEFWQEFNSITQGAKNNVGAIRNLTEFDVMSDIFERENFDELMNDYKDFDLIRNSWYYGSGNEEKFARLREREAISGKYHVPMAYEGVGVIEIDLSASDEQLIDNFSRWLLLQRESTSNKRSARITKAHFKDWAESKVLAYFDLVTIAKIDGLRISNHMLGDLLFPDEIDVDVSERIRKVTKVKANKVFSVQTIEVLEAQIKEE
jgi:hypothetical protein